MQHYDPPSLHFTRLHQRWLSSSFYSSHPSTRASSNRACSMNFAFFPSSSCQLYSRLTRRSVTPSSPEFYTIDMIYQKTYPLPYYSQENFPLTSLSLFFAGFESPTASIAVATFSIPSYYSLPPLSASSSVNAGGHTRRKSKDRRYWGFLRVEVFVDWVKGHFFFFQNHV
jgi:hypothetical protein